MPCMYCAGRLTSPFKRVIMFVDNAGADVVLGMLPFAREFLRMGSEVRRQMLGAGCAVLCTLFVLACWLAGWLWESVIRIGAPQRVSGVVSAVLGPRHPPDCGSRARWQQQPTPGPAAPPHRHLHPNPHLCHLCATPPPGLLLPHLQLPPATSVPQVVLVGNSLPAINDITGGELRSVVAKAAEACPIIRAARDAATAAEAASGGRVPPFPGEPAGLHKNWWGVGEGGREAGRQAGREAERQAGRQGYLFLCSTCGRAGLECCPGRPGPSPHPPQHAAPRTVLSSLPALRPGPRLGAGLQQRVPSSERLSSLELSPERERARDDWPSARTCEQAAAAAAAGLTAAGLTVMGPACVKPVLLDLL